MILSSLKLSARSGLRKKLLFAIEKEHCQAFIIRHKITDRAFIIRHKITDRVFNSYIFRRLNICNSLTNVCINDRKTVLRRFSSSQDKNIVKDPYDKYRQPITPELWQEFQQENLYTQEHAVDLKLWNEMYQEMKEATSKIWEQQEPPSDYGPTGKWLYRFILSQPTDHDMISNNDDTARRRIFERKLSNINCLVEQENSLQTVIEIQPQEELLSMSLTPDETCIAVLSLDSITKETKLKLRNVTTQKEIVFDNGIDVGGDTVATQKILNIEWGPIVKDEKDGMVQSLYVVFSDDCQGRPNRVAAALICPKTLKFVSKDTFLEIYESEDPAVLVDVQRTKGCQYLAIQALKKTSNEIYLADHPFRPLRLVLHRMERIMCYLDVGKHDDVIILISDERACGNYKFVETSVQSLPLTDYTSKNSSTDFLVNEEESKEQFSIENMDMFRHYLVLYERSTETGQQRVRIRKRKSIVTTESKRDHEDRIIDLSNLSTISWSKLTQGGNMYFEADFVRFEVESPVIPVCGYEYSFVTEKIRKVSGIEPDEASRSIVRYSVFVQSMDGTRVPLTIFSNSQFPNEKHLRSGNEGSPVVLIGYGCYGEPINLGYDPTWLPLLKRGAILAFASTRGGGDLGRSWYFAGRRENKTKAIDDFIACATYLKSKYPTMPLNTEAFSAAGVLVGAAVNRCPGLFDKVVLTNAFVDVLGTMQNPSLYLTEHEYDEFGNPNDDELINETIRDYCPIFNLDPLAQSETSTKFLVIGTVDDPNVPYWNATIYFKKLNIEKPTDGKHPSQKNFLYLLEEGGHRLSGLNRVGLSSLENAFLLGKQE